jgi:hypothetical protein
MRDPHESEWKAAKRILRYIWGTYQFGIEYTKGGSSSLPGFTNSDWAGNFDDQKFTSGYTFNLSSAEKFFGFINCSQSLVLPGSTYNSLVQQTKCHPHCMQSS